MAQAKKSTEGLDLINTSLSPSQIIDSIVMAYCANMPCFLWGPPGTAKSQLFRQAQARLQVMMDQGYFGKDEIGQTFGLYDFRMITRDTTDLNGIPGKSQDGKYTEWLRPKGLPEKGRGIYLLDEMNSASGMMQAAGYGLVLDRISGEHHLAKGWVPMAAGNYDTDGGVTTRQPTPLKSRFLHLNIQTLEHPTRKGTYQLVNQKDWSDEWIEWAITNEIHPHVIAYHRKTSGTNLYAFDKAEQTYPCLRSWEFVSNMLKQGLQGKLLYPVIAGLVGKGYASEVVGYMEQALELPDLEFILANPKKAPIPQDIGMKYAVVTMLGVRVKERKEFVSALEYMDRKCTKHNDRCPKDKEHSELGTEFMVVAVRDMVMRTKALQTSPEFIKLVAVGTYFGDSLMEIEKGLKK